MGAPTDTVSLRTVLFEALALGDAFGAGVAQGLAVAFNAGEEPPCSAEKCPAGAGCSS